MDRRQFSRAVAGAITAASYNRILGANDRLGMGLIGSGRRGREVMKAFLDTNQAGLLAICDIYDVQRERARELLVHSAEKPFECAAHQELLARNDIDAVLIATPYHLHMDLGRDRLCAQRKRT